MKKSADYLKECIEVQKQRGEQYDSKGTGERSFAACAAAFNAVTGKDLKGSDICLILQYLKDVRQYSDPTRIHEDSLLDKVSYGSLHAEELNKELGGEIEQGEVKSNSGKKRFKFVSSSNIRAKNSTEIFVLEGKVYIGEMVNHQDQFVFKSETSSSCFWDFSHRNFIRHCTITEWLD